MAKLRELPGNFSADQLPLLKNELKRVQPPRGTEIWRGSGMRFTGLNLLQTLLQENMTVSCRLWLAVRYIQPISHSLSSARLGNTTQQSSWVRLRRPLTITVTGQTDSTPPSSSPLWGKQMNGEWELRLVHNSSLMLLLHLHTRLHPVWQPSYWIQSMMNFSDVAPFHHIRSFRRRLLHGHSSCWETCGLPSIGHISGSLLWHVLSMAAPCCRVSPQSAMWK